jgi:hypothetical protein
MDGKSIVHVTNTKKINANKIKNAFANLFGGNQELAFA